MSIFGVGPLEIILVVVIGILVLGPEGMVEAGKKLGKFLRSIVTSSWWQGVRQSVQEIQHLPQRLMREAELEELRELEQFKDLRKQELDLPRIGGDELLQGSSWMGGNSNQSQDKNQTEPASPSQKSGGNQTD